MQEGLYQSKVTYSLAYSHGSFNQAHICKMAYCNPVLYDQRVTSEQSNATRFIEFGFTPEMLIFIWKGLWTCGNMKSKRVNPFLSYIGFYSQSLAQLPSYSKYGIQISRE